MRISDWSSDVCSSDLKDYQIFVFNVASGKTTKPEISLARNPVLGKEQEFNVDGHVSDFDVSPDGKKLAFVSRGELFVSDIEGKFVRKMPGSGERVMEVKWLSDRDRKSTRLNSSH